MTKMTEGVMRAATPHPNFRKMTLDSSIMMNVTAPVLEEKSPMKEEYSLGLGNCILILLFQVTSTRLMLIPYETTWSRHISLSAWFFQPVLSLSPVSSVFKSVAAYCLGLFKQGRRVEESFILSSKVCISGTSSLRS